MRVCVAGPLLSAKSGQIREHRPAPQSGLETFLCVCVTGALTSERARIRAVLSSVRSVTKNLPVFYRRSGLEAFVDAAGALHYLASFFRGGRRRNHACKPCSRRRRGEHNSKAPVKTRVKTRTRMSSEPGSQLAPTLVFRKRRPLKPPAPTIRMKTQLVLTAMVSRNSQKHSWKLRKRTLLKSAGSKRRMRKQLVLSVPVQRQSRRKPVQEAQQS